MSSPISPSWSNLWPARHWGWGSPDRADSRGTKQTQTLRALEQTSATDVQLQIQTKEGDTVTLTVHAEVDQAALDLRTRTRGPGGRSSSEVQLAGRSASESISVSVNGDLNASEQADVNALLDQVKRAVQGFLDNGTDVSLPAQADAAAANGTADPNVASDANSGSLSTLAGYQVDVQRTDSVEALVLRLRTWTPAQSGDNASSDPASANRVGSSSAATDPVAVPIDTTDAAAAPADTAASTPPTTTPVAAPVTTTSAPTNVNVQLLIAAVNRGWSFTANHASSSAPKGVLDVLRQFIADFAHADKNTGVSPVPVTPVAGEPDTGSSNISQTPVAA